MSLSHYRKIQTHCRGSLRKLCRTWRTSQLEHIYTEDGAFCGLSLSCWGTISGSLIPKVSRFTADLCAISESINNIFIKGVESSRYTIISDPQSVTVALNQRPQPLPSLRKLKNFRRKHKQNTRIEFCWVPGYANDVNRKLLMKAIHHIDVERHW